MSRVNDEFEYYSDESAGNTLEHPKSISLSEQFPEYSMPYDPTHSKEYNKVCQELYDSERAYVKYLCIIQKIFINPLSKLPKVISRADLRSLFGELTSIFMTNQELLIALREYSKVFDAFNALVPFLKFYTAYARNYSTSQKIFNKLMLKANFREFIETQEQKSACGGIKFSALTIMPIQRIPRYILLLKRLHEEARLSKDRAEISDLLAQFDELTDLIQACITDFENSEKLWNVQESLGLSEDIVAPGRILLKEGTLFKRSHCGDTSYHERVFWLFNDILVYGKRRMGMGPKYECSCIFPLRHCVLNYNEIDGSLLIKCKSHTLLVTSDSYDRLKSWNDDMSEAISRARLLRSTLRKESSRQQVKEFKSQIKKRLTNKLINKTYHYEVGYSRQSKKLEEKSTKWDLMAKYSADINVMESPANDPNKRKRRADTAFDVELRTAILKRRTETVQEVEQKPESTNGSQTDYLGFDEVDRKPRMRSDIRNEAPTPRPVRPPPRPPAPLATLNRPEIRKYSYQDRGRPSTLPPAQSIESNLDKLADDQKTNGTANRNSIPWWVTESAPAEYNKAKERRGFRDTIMSSCSIM